MKYIFILLIVMGVGTSLDAQEKKPTEADKILKDLYGEKESSEEQSANTEEPKVETPIRNDNVEIFKEWLLASLEGSLMLLAPEDYSSFRRSDDDPLLPGLLVGTSCVSITYLLDEMKAEIKKDKVKTKFIAVNYLTEKEKKLSSMKIVGDVFYKHMGARSIITKDSFDPDANSILIYLQDETYHTIAFSADERIKESTFKIPAGVSGFLIQRNVDSDNYDYALVGIYNGVLGRMELFRSSTVEKMKKI